MCLEQVSVVVVRKGTVKIRKNNYHITVLWIKMAPEQINFEMEGENVSSVYSYAVLYSISVCIVHMYTLVHVIPLT